MFRVTSDLGKNRLYITLAGYMEGAERQEVVRAIMAEVAKLTRGFQIVTDISGLHASNEEAFKDFLRAKTALKLKGAGPIIRVVKIPLSRMQVERISEEAGFHEGSATSLQDADRQLDALRAEAKEED